MMDIADFIELVGIMRRDQIQRDNFHSNAAAMKARYSEKQVDDALAGMGEPPSCPTDLQVVGVGSTQAYVIPDETADEPAVVRGDRRASRQPEQGR